MLTLEQLAAISQYQRGIAQVREAIQKLNALAADTGFDIRHIPEYQLGLSFADSQWIVRQHSQELRQSQDEAMERMKVLKEFSIYE